VQVISILERFIIALASRHSGWW